MKTIAKNKWVIMNEEDGVPLWNVSLFANVFRDDLPKYTKFPSYFNIFEFDNYHFRGFFLDQQSLHHSQLLLDKVLKDPKYFSQVKNEVVKSSDWFYRFGKKVLETDPKKLSDKQLTALFAEFDRIFCYNVSFGMVSTLIDIPHGIFTHKVEEILNKRVVDLGLKTSPAEYFRILSSIKDLSKMQAESLAMLKLLAEIQRKKIPAKKILGNKTLYKKIQNHVKQFCWVYYAWMGPAFNEERVVRELKGLLEEKKNASKALRQWKKDYQRIAPNISKAEKELRLNPWEKQVFMALRETMRMKIIRKDALVFASFALEESLREVARRAGISFGDAQFIAPGEFSSVLRKDKAILNDLPLRKDYCVVVALKGKIKILSGQQGRKFLKAIYKEESFSGVREIRGQVACPGKRRGKVKIINLPSDMKKMEQGDILVSIATIPDIVPAMKKAAAIVTEQGGITSHAAIVSRELATPCVIGTKIATKVFKDGDMVEVDANRGIVRKIK